MSNRDKYRQMMPPVFLSLLGLISTISVVISWLPPWTLEPYERNGLAVIIIAIVWLGAILYRFYKFQKVHDDLDVHYQGLLSSHEKLKFETKLLKRIWNDIDLAISIAKADSTKDKLRILYDTKNSLAELYDKEMSANENIQSH